MAASPLALKLIGVGAVATVGTGGIILHKAGFFNGKIHNYTGIDKLAFNSNNGWTITANPNENTINSSGQTPIVAKIIVKWAGTEENTNKSWTCTVEGSIDNPVSGGSWGITSQKTSLEKKIGLNNEKAEKFKTFFDNCIRHRDSNTNNDTSSTSTINLRIKKDNANKYKFSDKFEKLYEGIIKTEKEIIQELGITTCEINSSSDCTLKEENLKSIKFSGQGESELTIENNKTPKLKIERTNDEEFFPEGLKFTFKIENNETTIKLNGKSENFLILKQSTNPEFKIKKEGQKYSLEKAWTAIDLFSKAVKNCIKSTDAEECTLQNNSTINLWKEANKYVIGATINNDQANKKISFVPNKENYNQAFQFKAGSDVTLTTTSATVKKPEEDSSIEWKLEQNNKFYEVVVKDIENNKKEWFLIEKTS